MIPLLRAVGGEVQSKEHRTGEKQQGDQAGVTIGPKQHKAPRRIVDVDIEYRGFEVGDEYLLGYGLDYEGRYRNLDSVWAVLDMVSFAESPESFAPVAYPAVGRPAR